MERLSIPSYSFGLKNYCLLTKPGILFGNLVTTVAGFALASKGRFDLSLLLLTLIGLSFVIGSACVFNNYIDREADLKMARTRKRSLALTQVTPKRALLFAVILGVLGSAILGLYSNLLTLALALFGFLVYVVLYTLSKYRSIHGTLIGSVAGAVPPVAGYTAVSDQLDLGALLLFAMLVFWQMPHFFAIALYRLEDYKAASIPVLPAARGSQATKVQMLFYILLFLVPSSLLTFFGYTPKAYLVLTLGLGGAWLLLAFCGLQIGSLREKQWGKQMFFFSLAVILTLSLTITFIDLK